MCLTECDAAGILAHLDDEVEVEEPQVAHVERRPHLHLESLHLLRTGGDQVVDVDTDE